MPKGNKIKPPSKINTTINETSIRKQYDNFYKIMDDTSKKASDTMNDAIKTPNQKKIDIAKDNYKLYLESVDNFFKVVATDAKSETEKNKKTEVTVKKLMNEAENLSKEVETDKTKTKKSIELMKRAKAEMNIYEDDIENTKILEQIAT